MKSKLLIETQNNYALLTNLLIKRNISITVMESCTSGIVSSFITDVDNSSKIFRGSFVTYCNDAKINLGIKKTTINKYGVYSKETSMEMAKICKKKMNTDIGIGITGSLGIVDPNNQDSVKGEVYFTIDFLKTNSFCISIENQGSKFLNKVYTANVICLELLKELER